LRGHQQLTPPDPEVRRLKLPHRAAVHRWSILP